MHIKSFLNQKWVIKIKPAETNINVDKDFLKRINSKKKEKITGKSKINYDLIFKLNKFASFKLKDFGLETKLKGDIIYKSKKRNIIADLKSNFDGKGFINLKLNSNLNNDLYSLEVLSKGVNLDNYEFDISNRKITLKKGKFKSKVKFFKSPSNTFCKGTFSLDKLSLKSSGLSEDINSDSLSFTCRENSLKGNTQNLNYGSLTSDFNLYIPLERKSKDIILKGTIGYENSLNPDINLSANIPYWFDKRGINFGNLNSRFDINRTQLSNLNIFRKNRIRGFVTANGELKGKINDPKLLINFNIDYPEYKGIRIREIWEGGIKNENNKFFLSMKNGSSPIPTYLTMRFDSNINFENLNFIRVFNSSNKGILKINKGKNEYIWNADNFPLDVLEFGNINGEFKRIGGIINGSGFISSSESYLDGTVAWSLGQYGNIKLDNSLFDFYIKDKSFFVKSTLFPTDGGNIQFEYDSNSYSPFNASFNDISTSWSLVTLINIFNLDNRNESIRTEDTKVISDIKTAGKIFSKNKNKSKQKKFTGNSKDLDNLSISKDDMTVTESVKFIDDFLREKLVSEDKYNFKKYLNKLDSRISEILSIKGNGPQNYKIKTNLEGYIDIPNKVTKKNKEEFSINLEGGLIKGKGSLEVKELPLKVFNIFLNKPKDFIGGLDIKLNYDLDNKKFLGFVDSENLALKNNKLSIDKGKFEYSDSEFDIDLALVVNNSGRPINLYGTVPFNKYEKLNLNFVGNGKFAELIDFFADDYFSFSEGDINFRMILSGSINKPIANGFIDIKDSEIEILNNSFKNIKSKLILDYDQIIIEKFNASVNNSQENNLWLFGKLPFENEINTKEDFNKGLKLSFVPSKVQSIESLNNVFSNEKFDKKNNSEKNSLKDSPFKAFYQKGVLDLNDLENFRLQIKPEIFNQKNILLKTSKLNLITSSLDFLVDSNINVSGSFANPILGGDLSINNGFINLGNSEKNNISKNIKEIKDEKNWPELNWDNNENLEIISNETVLNSVLLGNNLPNYYENLVFDNLKLKLGPEFKIQYNNIFKAFLETKVDLNIKGKVGKDLSARGWIYLKKGRANLYTTPFKLDKNKDNSILFVSRNGAVPYIKFSLISKVPDSIIPISENSKDINISGDLNVDNNSDFGAFGIGNSRMIKIEASYEGFLDQLSFEDENKKIQYRSTPSYSRSQIIGLIGGNSANLINRAFISQFNSADAFSERFQLSLYPALVENNDSLNNIFSKENLEIENDLEFSSSEELSSQAWVAEIGLDITDSFNFAVQSVPGRDDLPPVGILTFQANPNLELLGSFDSDGDWKSQIQLFFRY